MVNDVIETKRTYLTPPNWSLPMDTGSYEVILTMPGLLEKDFQVSCDPWYDRKALNESDEALLEQAWQERVKASPKLFNGAKFRFAGVTMEKSGKSAHLRLGITDYRSFIGTNLAPHWERLLALSPDHLASPLGNAAIVETSDGQVVLLRRGGGVGEALNSVVMPGGHPESEEVGIQTKSAWESQYGCNVQSSPSWAERCRKETFDAMIREIEEETGISGSVLMPMRCIGFCRRVQNHRPDMIFHMRCSLTSAKVQDVYHATRVEYGVQKGDSDGIFTLSRDELIRQVLDENALPMPGGHRGAVHLYRSYLAATGHDKYRGA